MRQAKLGDVVSHRPARRFKQVAFTLIELLLAIASLASLLLPALNRAKAKAQGIRCQGNLRQHIVAWQIFARNSNDRLPFSHHCFELNQPGDQFAWVLG